MTLDQLRMLVQVAESGSVLAAAEALQRTQPTVSVAIRKLEEEFALQLLDRNSYRARLTPAGDAFCRKARQLLGQAEELSALAQHLSTGAEPELRIAIEASCPMGDLLDTLGRCEKRYPATRFNLLGENIRGALERLREQDADLAISPWFEEDVSLETFRLLKTELVAVAAPSFVPLQRTTPLYVASLRDEAQVVVKDSSRIQSGGSFGVLEGGRYWFVNDHLAKKEIILAGLGWGRLQRHLVEKELAEGRLVTLPLVDFEVVMEIDVRVVRRRGASPGPVAASLWEELQLLAARQG